MNKLLSLIKENDADTLPASDEQIARAELALGLTFSPEYRSYLQSMGVVSFGANETFGLGVKDTSFLNIVSALSDFRSFANFPHSLIPISDIGDGHYYMYDNANREVVTIAVPDMGIKFVSDNLESFLINLLFRE
ncbi:hypothetical protein HR45_13655 [Shewanella mangrovi]|uniref:Knr4/Smi1-like domain-containing protein n=1 Tax=Shewanella mangrovi TaxID=1515746 RepID=A0A094JWR1_9GAMM|nr:SMI1/KNR4 family protein [Shewanella mangrovi]KFZ36846.1 hypothetical protein HR45_13655 [Shewanella mangrovi]